MGGCSGGDKKGRRFEVAVPSRSGSLGKCKQKVEEVEKDWMKEFKGVGDGWLNKIVLNKLFM